MSRFKYRVSFILAIVVAVGTGIIAQSSIRELAGVIEGMRADQQVRASLLEILVTSGEIQRSGGMPGTVITPGRRSEITRATAVLEGETRRLALLVPRESQRAGSISAVVTTAHNLAAISRHLDHDSYDERQLLVESLVRQVDTLLRGYDAQRAVETPRVMSIVQRTSWAIAIGGILSVLMVIAGGLMQQRQVRERSIARNAMVAANEELRTKMDELHQRAKEIEMLSEMGELLQVSASVDELREIVALFGRWMFPRHDGAFYSIRASRDLAEPIAVWGAGAAAVSIDPGECWALRRGRPHGRTLVSQVGCHHGVVAGRATLCLPMSAQGETTGVFSLTADEGLEIEPQVASLAKAVADQVALSVANLQLQESLRTRAIRDPLTNLFNRRYMEESLERELGRAARGGSVVGVLMIDVDHFKQFNDTFGHAGGDAYLQQVAALMQGSFRTEDIVCRYGGEEFTVIVPDMSGTDLYARAEDLRVAVSSLQVRLDGENIGRTTVSIGLAVAPADGETARKVLASADHALYAAKRGGRNRVVQASLPTRAARMNALVVVGAS